VFGIPNELHDDEIAYRDGVRVRRVDDLNAAGATGHHVDVLKTHATPTHDFELRAAREQGGVHPGVGAYHHPDRVGQCGVEFGGTRGGLDDSGSLPQPRQRRRI
jgi:hypothetical protein